MFSKTLLAAGAAALAITAPVAAKPDKGGGNGGGNGAGPRAEQRSGGGGGQMRAERRGGGHQQIRIERRGGGDHQQIKIERRGGGGDMRRAQQQRFEPMRAARPQRVEIARQRPEQRFDKPAKMRELRAAARRDERAMRAGVGPERRIARQALRVEQAAAREQRKLVRDQMRVERQINKDVLRTERQIARAALNTDRQIAQRQFRSSRLAALNYGAPSALLAPVVVSQYVGQPLSSLAQVASLGALPQPVQYLYPESDDYYYRYGGGYVYRVERDNDLVDWVLPLLASGFLPGQYLPQNYMTSYAPDYYGLSSFYPASYDPYAYGYGYGGDYDELCNRYYDGVVYQVDCDTGFIEDVVPLYAGGYGVGQMLPAASGYYNVPYQYRDVYYNDDGRNYWYAPGAIYQVDPKSNLITAVAALLSSGFTVGQRLPAGYSMYNVPMGYRDTYYDTDDAWYRYNNGYIYQVDPTTQLVTAIVAAILT